MKKLVVDKKVFSGLVKRSAIAVNVSLYFLFIIIVFVFNYAGGAPTSKCGGRVALDLSEYITLKRNISIAYSTIIAVITFVIGVLYAVFGFKITRWVTLSKSNKNPSARQTRVLSYF